MLAFAGGKGGCGKTTTTLGVAAALGRCGADPLVVDGDCDMPDVHHRLGLPRDEGIDALARGRPLRAVTSRTDALPGVSVVQGGKREALEPALRRAQPWDGPVLVDCGAGTNPDAVTPLRHAERAIIVSTDQPQCIEDAETTRRIAWRLDTSVAGVVVRRSVQAGADDTVSTRRRIPPEWHILGDVPVADTPLEDDSTMDVFQTIAAAVYQTTGTGDRHR
ncbi:MinD/ParA family ATP-binding protein [Halovenus salina]|nr:cobyrinic acid ac-diamide synthase [Halovenus salina]